MRKNRIATKMGLIFSSFAILVLVSLGVSFWGLNAQKLDAVVINLAGRQRMLVQQMRSLAVDFENQGKPEHLAGLEASQQIFEQTIHALRIGGSAPYYAGDSVELPPTQDEEILRQIDQVEQTWLKFRENLAVIRSAPRGSQALTRAVDSLDDIAPELLTQADNLVHLYETKSTAIVNSLRWAQLIFLLSALALLLRGFWIIHHSVVQPLQELSDAAQRIGGGDLQAQVQVRGSVEIELLSATMEEMRGKLLTSQKELQIWAAKLEERVSQRTRELEALNSVSREVSSRLDIQQVLNSVVEKSRQLMEADVAFLCLLDEQKNSLSLQSASGALHAIAASSTTLEASWASRVIASDHALRYQDEGCLSCCQIVDKSYRGSQIAAPLKIENSVIGAMCVASQQPGFFAKDSLGLLTRLANIAAVAIENARLYTRLERSAALEERHRIAAEIHDGLAQTLRFLAISTEQAREQLENKEINRAEKTLARMQDGVEQASLEVRRAIASLQDDFPTQYTLQEQLNSLTQEMAGSNHSVAWVNRARVPIILGQQKAEQVLRVVREAVINAQKHGRATHISVILKRSNHTAAVSIEDNGVGFDARVPPGREDREHFGLKIMQARAAHLDGKLDIYSRPGKGARVVLTWPLERNQTDEDISHSTGG